MPYLDIDPSSLLQLDRLTKKFGDLLANNNMLNVATEAAAKYILAVFRKEIPAYRYVSRKQAYGKTFFSDKQRRWFFANDMQNKIPYARRSPGGGLATGWHMIGSGANLTLVNNQPAATWAYSEAQARQLALVGWRKASTTLEEKERNATDAAARALQKEINKTMG